MAVLLGAVLLLVYAAGVPFGVSSLKTVVGADRILRGDVPYRDFWTMYAPGSAYAVAAAFALLGRELWIQSLLCAATQAAALALFFDALRVQGVGRRPALLLATAGGLMLWAPSPEWASYPSALLCLMLAVRLVAPRLARGEGGRLFLAGCALGVAAWFKHDVAFHGALALGLTVLLAPLVAPAEGERRRGPSFAALARLAAGALAAALPAVLLLAWVAGADAWRDLVVFPATDFPRVFGDPYPPWLPSFAPLLAWLGEPGDLAKGQVGFGVLAGWAVCILPHVFFWGALALLALVRPVGSVRGGSASAGWRASLLLWTLWIPPFWAAAHVQQNTHVWSMGLACFALFGLAWTELGPRLGPLARVALALPLALLAAGHLLRPAMSLFLLLVQLPDGRWLGLPGARFVRVSAEEAGVLRPITLFVRAHVPPDEPIHVGVQRHDAIVISNQRFYYLADRAPATRYNELHPGITDREDVQREMIADLESSGVRCVVLWRFGWPRERLDAIRDRRRELVPGAGSTLFDEHLRTSFRELERHGQYSILWRRGESPEPLR